MNFKILSFILGLLFLPMMFFGDDIWESTKKGDLEQAKKMVEVGGIDINIKGNYIFNYLN